LETLLAAAGRLIDLALAEDLGPGDATSEAVLPADLILRGHIVAKQAGVVAGLPIVGAVFSQVDPALTLACRVQDGTRVRPGDRVAEVSGPARAMLSAERTALNFLQRLSGIATLTRSFVDAVAGTQARILDTRKTHPGYRVLEKYAVRMGGGHNHRMGLHDMVLIKDNHIQAAGSITTAVERARAARPDLPLEVEVRSLDELREALALEPDRIMLDNMSLDDMRAAVRVAAGRVALEASGGIDLERVAAVAATGVDYISVGALTHSAPALDLSLEIVGRRPGQPAANTVARKGDTHLEPDAERLAALRAQLGDRLCILGHHYQRDEVIRFADLRGDSLKLAHAVAQVPHARTIIFCGVHFMAETAAILARPDQVVLIPDLEAGCPLAEMADRALVERAWAELGGVIDVEGEVMPVTYVNSTADLKAFCGQHGGLVCTSSNAQAVLSWALSRRRRVLFVPDQHLGRNTARRMGIPLTDMALWDPRRPLGGHDAAALERARIVLWRGWCNVHQRFLPEHVVAWRERMPGVRVMVHPECPMAVVDLADEIGSTQQIIQRVEESSPGAKWVIGTEFRLVDRLRREHPQQFIASLSPEPSYCRTMSMITLEKVTRVVEGLVRGEQINRVTVDPETARFARLALERMLEVGP
jgi:quinolinate synthase